METELNFPHSGVNIDCLFLLPLLLLQFVGSLCLIGLFSIPSFSSSLCCVDLVEPFELSMLDKSAVHHRATYKDILRGNLVEMIHSERPEGPGPTFMLEGDTARQSGENMF